MQLVQVVRVGVVAHRDVEQHVLAVGGQRLQRIVAFDLAFERGDAHGVGAGLHVVHRGRFDQRDEKVKALVGGDAQVAGGLVEDHGFFARIDDDVDLEHEDKDKNNDDSHQYIFTHVFRHGSSVFHGLVNDSHEKSVPECGTIVKESMSLGGRQPFSLNFRYNPWLVGRARRMSMARAEVLPLIDCTNVARVHDK